MNYVIVGIAAVVIIGGISYLIYRKRVARQPGVSEEKAPEETLEPSEPAPEATSAAFKEPSRTTAPSVPSRTATVAPEVAKLEKLEKVAQLPVVPEISSLPENAKNQLMNAVWYRCENPNCNYTQFLDVHHILSEVEGGTNRPDNLIVLCTACHTAALKGEISVEELQSWVQSRAERFKSDLDWPYK